MTGAFKEDNGRWSSRKVAGLTVVGVSIVMGLIDQLSDSKVNIIIWATMFGGGMTMLGIKNIKIFNK